MCADLMIKPVTIARNYVAMKDLVFLEGKKELPVPDWTQLRDEASRMRLMTRSCYCSTCISATSQKLMKKNSRLSQTDRIMLSYYGWYITNGIFADEGYVRRAPRDGWST